MQRSGLWQNPYNVTNIKREVVVRAILYKISLRLKNHLTTGVIQPTILSSFLLVHPLAPMQLGAYYYPPPPLSVAALPDIFRRVHAVF